jgi:hypothetical protein
MCIEFKAPEKVKNPNNWLSLFEAGAIDQGKSWNWQADLTEYLNDTSCVILNPRRDDWDSSWEQSIDNDDFRGQVEWELDGMEMATVVAMCLPLGSTAPISLLELGLHASDGKMIVFCPEGFYRKGNVDVVCQRYGVPVYEDFDEFCKNVKARMLETIAGTHKEVMTASDKITRRMMAREFIIGLRKFKVTCPVCEQVMMTFDPRRYPTHKNKSGEICKESGWKVQKASYDKPHLEIPQFPIQAADANMEYDRKLKEVRKLVNELEKLLWKHEARQGGRTYDWGFVGDLEHLEGQLTEMVRFIGGGTRG